MSSMPGFYTFPIVANPTLFHARHTVEQGTNYKYGNTGSSFTSSQKGLIDGQIDSQTKTLTFNSVQPSSQGKNSQINQKQGSVQRQPQRKSQKICWIIIGSIFLIGIIFGILAAAGVFTASDANTQQNTQLIIAEPVTTKTDSLTTIIPYTIDPIQVEPILVSHKLLRDYIN